MTRRLLTAYLLVVLVAGAQQPAGAPAQNVKLAG